jgi:MYXO-CTERM domain-containing protein
MAARVRWGKLPFVLGLVGIAGAAGCFLGKDDVATSSGDEVKAAAGDVLKATVVLDEGCTATKVGPRHLLLAARCVADKPAFAAGKTISFRVANSKDAAKPAEPEADEETPAPTAPTNAGPTGEEVFTKELYPLVEPTCAGCHAVAGGRAPVYFGANAAASYPLFKERNFHVAGGIYLKKGDHAGPALKPEQKAAAEKWIAAEAAAAAPTTPTPSTTKTDAGARPKPANRSATKATIASVAIDEAYAEKCKAPGSCEIGSLGAGSVRDLAVLVLDADLTAIPTIPVDLDPVVPGDPLVAVSSGCEAFDGKASAAATVKTVAVPHKHVNHAGSPFKEKPAVTSTLNNFYVVTPGPGWDGAAARSLCKIDLGAPLVRPGKPAVAGVTSSFTTWGDAGELVPVTVHHAKVDTASKAGGWLKKLGVATTSTCGKDGCPKPHYDGGAPRSDTDGTTAPGDAGAATDAAPRGDAGADADAGESREEETEELPGSSNEEELTEEEELTADEEESDEDSGARPAKKKAAPESSCSAAPIGSNGAGSTLFIGLALAGAAALRRRRRRAAL